MEQPTIDELGQQLVDLDRKMREAETEARRASAAVLAKHGLRDLRKLRDGLTKSIREKREAEMRAKCGDLPDTWLWTEPGHAERQGKDVYIDADGDMVFESDDGDIQYRPVEVVRAVLAHHDAGGEVDA